VWGRAKTMNQEMAVEKLNGWGGPALIGHCLGCSSSKWVEKKGVQFVSKVVYFGARMWGGGQREREPTPSKGDDEIR